MTEYLKSYMKILRQSIDGGETAEELERIMAEHKDKIAFMQHERLVHFLVTMMFAIILVIFMGVFLVTENMLVSLLVIIITVLLGFYIKHYYFLENTVQEMYRLYDEINEKAEAVSVKDKSEEKQI